MKSHFTPLAARRHPLPFRCSLGALLIAVGCSGHRSTEEELKRQFPELAAAMTDRDRAEASTEIGKTDGNGDGIVTEEEWRASRYQPVERFKNNDLNGDGVLTPYEHSLRWAQYRMGREQAAKKNGGKAAPRNGPARQPARR